MKSTKIVQFIFAGIAAAHSAVYSVNFDGVSYPARSPVDSALDVERIEWKSTSPFTFMPLSNMNDPSLTCQAGATPPEIKAYARAGSNVNIRWSPVVSGHVGPVINYLGRLESPSQRPQDVKFFKIAEKSFDPKTGMWGNQLLVQNNHTETIQLPSDIKAGTYIFRTELLALHGTTALLEYSTAGGTQFYPHCFTVEIAGSGTVITSGVKIPGAYDPKHPGMKLTPGTNLKYVVPGPPLYTGRFDAPVGTPAVVRNTGAFPSQLQKKYEVLSKKFETAISGILDPINKFDFVNSKSAPPSFEDVFKLLGGMTASIVGGGSIMSDIAELKAEIAETKLI